MTTRTITATTAGPITIDVGLLGHAGIITVRADADCEVATLTITTADMTGPAAAAVRAADLRQASSGLVASVRGQGGNGRTTTARGRGVTVVQGSSVVTGSGGTVLGDVHVDGGHASVAQGAPITIDATVPTSTSVRALTNSADIRLDGSLLNVHAVSDSGSVDVTGHAARVTAKGASGDVSVEWASLIDVSTMSGRVRVGTGDVVTANTMSGGITVRALCARAQLAAMSGDVRVHVVTGADITATSMSGDVTVTATKSALADGLDIRAQSMTGRTSTPPRH